MAALAPRSYNELKTLIRKDDGWYAGIGSHAPYRLLETLITRAETFPSEFRDIDLPASAVLVVQHFLATTRTFRPPRVTQLIVALPSADERAEAEAAVRQVEQAIGDAGDIARWGATHPERTPSSQQRLAAITAAIESAHVRVGLQAFHRFADMADHAGLAEIPRGPDAPWRRTPATQEVIRQAIGLQFDQQAVAVAFQEISDQFGLAGHDPTDKEMKPVGAMLVSLTKTMLALRPPRTGPRTNSDDGTRVEVEAAIRHLAAQPLPGLIPRETWLTRLITWAAPVLKVLGVISQPVVPAPSAVLTQAGGLVEKASGTLSKALDQFQVHQLYSAVSAASVLAPVYSASIAARKRVRAPEQMVPENQYGRLYAAVSALRLSTFRSLGDCLVDPRLADAPMRYLHERRREGDAHRAVWAFLTRITALDPHTGAGFTIPSADDLLTARGAQRDGRPLLGEGVTARGLHAAAIAVLQLRRGVPLEQLEDDLVKGRLPGVRGSCRGVERLANGAQLIWDLPHTLGAADQALVLRAARAANLDRVLTQAAHAPIGRAPQVSASQVSPPVAPIAPVPLLASAHQRTPPHFAAPSLELHHTVHRGALADGVSGLLTSEWALRYTAGRVRVRLPDPNMQPLFVDLAVLEAHETAAFLAGRSHDARFDTPHAVRWLDGPSAFPVAQQWQLPHEERVTRIAISPDPIAPGTTPVVDITGPLPPVARDMLAAIAITAPESLALPARPRRPLPMAEMLADGTQPHQQQLAAAARQLIAAHPVRGASRGSERVKALPAPAPTGVSPTGVSMTETIGAPLTPATSPLTSL